MVGHLTSLFCSTLPTLPYSALSSGMIPASNVRSSVNINGLIAMEASSQLFCCKIYGSFYSVRDRSLVDKQYLPN